MARSSGRWKTHSQYITELNEQVKDEIGVQAQKVQFLPRPMLSEKLFNAPGSQIFRLTNHLRKWNPKTTSNAFSQVDAQVLPFGFNQSNHSHVNIRSLAQLLLSGLVKVFNRLQIA
jgi:hypothetical protein